MAKSKTVDPDVGLVLQVINSCQDLHVLPKPGGLLDQDPLFMSIYFAVMEARNARAELDSKKSGN